METSVTQISIPLMVVLILTTTLTAAIKIFRTCKKSQCTICSKCFTMDIDTNDPTEASEVRAVVPTTAV